MSATQRDRGGSALSLGWCASGKARGSYVLGADRNGLVETMWASAGPSEMIPSATEVEFLNLATPGGALLRREGQWAWSWVTEPEVANDTPTTLLTVEGNRDDVLEAYDSWQVDAAPAHLTAIGIDALFMDAARPSYLSQTGRRFAAWTRGRIRVPGWSVLSALGWGATWMSISTPTTVRVLRRDLGMVDVSGFRGEPALASIHGPESVGVLRTASRLQELGFELLLMPVPKLGSAMPLVINGVGALREAAETANQAMRNRFATWPGNVSYYPSQLTPDMVAVIASGGDPSLFSLVYELTLSGYRLGVARTGVSWGDQADIGPWTGLEALYQTIRAA